MKNIFQQNPVRLAGYFFVSLIVFLGMFFVLPVSAGVGANPGDVRIFTMAHTLMPLKTRLLVQTDHQFVFISGESPKQEPAGYYTFLRADINKGIKLDGKSVYVELFDFSQNKWTVPILLIPQYDPNEAPFYQFLCWFEGVPLQPHCWIGRQR